MDPSASQISLIFAPCGVVSYQHTSLLDVVELPLKLQLMDYGAGGKDPLQVPPSILRRLRTSYVPEHLVVNTRGKAVQD